MQPFPNGPDDGISDFVALLMRLVLDFKTPMQFGEPLHPANKTMRVLSVEQTRIRRIYVPLLYSLIWI
jgi:hypothetical protein